MIRNRNVAVVALALVAACGAPQGTPDLDDGFDVASSEEFVTGIACPVNPDLDLCETAPQVLASSLRIGATATSAGEVAQTFEPTRDAPIASVVLKLRRLRPLPAEPALALHLDVRNASGPVLPGAGSNLATASVLLTAIGADDTTFAFPSGGPMLEAGTRYALVLRADAPTSGSVLVGVASQPTNAYAHGEALRRGVRAGPTTTFVRTGLDLAFAVVLEPGDPIASVTPGPIVFASTNVGLTASAQGVVVTNTGAGPLHVGTPLISGDFALSSNGCTAPVARNASCTLQVTFTPTQGGARTGTLQIPHDAAGGSSSVALSGTGLVPPVAGFLDEPNVVQDGGGCCLNWLKHWRFRVTTSGVGGTMTFNGWFTATCTGCIPPNGTYGYTITPPAPGVAQRVSNTISGYPSNQLLTHSRALVAGRWKVDYDDFLTLQFDVNSGGSISVVSYIDKSRGNANRVPFLTVTNTPQ